MSQTFVHDFTIYKIPLKIHKKKTKKLIETKYRNSPTTSKSNT